MSVRQVEPSEFLAGGSIVMAANPKMIDGLKKVRLESAREFAVQAHGDQLYGDKPYAEHLSAVVRVAEEFEASLDSLTAAWLHDVVEDTAVTLEQVRAKFGEQVSSLVWAVTGEGQGDRRAHAASICEKIIAHPAAAEVKLADRIANIEACAPGDKHALRYSGEHAEFEEAIKPNVSEPMWRRYVDALKAKVA